MFRSINDIKYAVNDGKTVYHQSKAYQVIQDSKGQWLIYCVLNGFCIGLTWRINAKDYDREISKYCFVDTDGQILNGKLEDFFVE